MFHTVKNKIDLLADEGYLTRYDSPQIVWERLRAGEPVLFKLIREGKVVRQFDAQPDKLGVYFREIPATDDYCRFHEEPIKEEEGEV